MNFLGSKREDDFGRVKAWEYQEGWNNPFSGSTDDEDIDVDADDNAGILEVGTVRSERTGPSLIEDEDEDLYNADADDSHQGRKSRKKRSKKKKRKKHISEEESSQADSLLSEILDVTEMDDSEGNVDQMKTLEEGDDEDIDDADADDDNDSMQVVASTTREKKEHGVSARYGSRYTEKNNKIVDSSDDEGEEEEEEEEGNDDVDAAAADDGSSMRVQGYQRDDASTIDDGYNPFDGMNALLKTEKSRSGDDSLPDEPSSLLPPPSGASKSNPFADDEDDEDDEVASDADEDFMAGLSTEADDDEESVGESEAANATAESYDDDEDIVESSKRLLRMADQRIQYQQHSDEVHDLKATIIEMESKAEAMAEQLRRATETKCDLVLAQNEMEKCREQDMLAKEDEIRDMRKYIQELLDAQARSELNFMNEISSLARKLDLISTKHKKEIDDKDAQIAELEQKLQSMKTGSVRHDSSREAFKSRFADVENRSVESNTLSMNPISLLSTII
eukprot:CAMPEP_0113498776 /NCGR_PEP_ID=MMETSP0014_2-20120614/31369_1 /TAXON_ID=2857 /ORGANISM="Nitzschia sp." /LENGTH=506 /DNA_ID=CAMNT_0000392855 /DNA_START=92 /DNA_END=1612 /DNA_ORIENTATION=+ /assembly_acc=CAM_ASM_000159